ncbi:MAG: MotA/TolQ/ExbB proton channel family protein [Myxococcales bacterium]|nr:MotA/TolQ/ExbB proton channel family protein [Myxococcales bacterium]MCB9646103.1 MotA/TolQ/ExbB proton channel family protein [Deltaproteobacteria bacterium]
MAELGHIIETGGAPMIANIFFLMVSIAIIIDRTIAVFFQLNLNGGRFMSQVEKLVVSDNIDKAVKLCNAAPKAALARVLRAGLTRANRGVLEIGNAIEEETLAVTPQVMKRVAALWSLANIAVLVGLFGTVLGLIKAFKAIGFAAPEQKQALLTNGISEAMNNTAFGLLIAVICIVGHLVISSQAKRIIEEIELHSLKLENMLSRRAVAELPEGR